MDDFEPIDIRVAREAIAQRGAKPSQVNPVGSSPLTPVARPGQINVSFDRQELREILNLYGRKVAEGEWRDYAIDFTPHLAVFSVFRRTSEMPLYRIEKNPKLAKRQGMYSVVTPTGLILKRGHELAKVLAILEKKLKVV